MWKRQNNFQDYCEPEVFNALFYRNQSSTHITSNFWKLDIFTIKTFSFNYFFSCFFFFKRKSVFQVIIKIWHWIYTIIYLMCISAYLGI